MRTRLTSLLFPLTGKRFKIKACPLLPQFGKVSSFYSFSHRNCSQTRAIHKSSVNSNCSYSMEIVKSENDSRSYRWITLDNGLSALLISDLLEGEEEPEDAGWDEEEEEEEEERRGDEEDDDEEEDMENDKEDKGEKKSAAALCIGAGSFSDPPDIPGFAHFLEHMVFMGSEKYPQENALDDFLGKHGGFTTAWTDCERSNFYFDVEQKYFHKSLDIFGQFFIKPLLRQDSVDREINAVDSEHQARLPSDDERCSMLYGTLAKEGHPMGKFFTGNIDSLKTIPQKNGIDVYGGLRDFCKQMYTAQHMTLAVQSKVSLEKLEKWVREVFSEVPNNKQPKQSFEHLQEPFETEKFHKLYLIDPVDDAHILEVKWSFPPMLPHYRKKPLAYLDFLLGHEGEGSLLSYLKNRYYATAVVSGHSYEGFDLNTTSTQFCVNLTLTDEGFKHYDEVLLAVFQYIKMIQSHGPQKVYFDEMKKIEDAKFRFKEKGDPMDYVEKVAENMQLFPPADVLTGRDLLFEYDAELIDGCLKKLKPDNCNIMLLSKKLSDVCDRQDLKWCPMRYTVRDIKKEWIQKWRDPPGNPEMTLPAPNKSIATDFTLSEIDKEYISKYPTVLSEDEVCTLYYKKDTKFSVPKAFVNVHLMSPVTNKSAESYTIMRIFESVLNHQLDAPAYPAYLAGYDYTIKIDDTGMKFTVKGFNHKLPELFDLLLTAVFEFSCSEELFPSMRNKVKREIFNAIIKPSEMVTALRFSVIDPYYWSGPVRYQVIDSLTNQMLHETIAEFRKKIKADILVVGNVTPKEAMWYKDRLKSKIHGKVLPSEMYKRQLYEVPQHWHYCQMKSLNKNDPNSCIMSYLQSDPGSIRTYVINELLDTRMQEPCFDYLRTQLQLGYTVYCQNLLTSGILGLGITVEFQAKKFDMSEVDKHIEDFLNKFKDILDKMTTEEFDSLVASSIAAKLTEDTHLGEEVSRYWRECCNQDYVFDRLEKEVNFLKSVTLTDLKEWYNQYLGKNQKRISFQVIGNTEAAETKDTEKESSTEPPSKKANNGHHTKEQSCEIVCLQDSHYHDNQCIRDRKSFQSNLHMYDYHTVTQ